jgi:hypothetical protein
MDWPAACAPQTTELRALSVGGVCLLMKIFVTVSFALAALATLLPVQTSGKRPFTFEDMMAL